MDKTKTKHFHLYVLKLEQNKYYIGITSKSPKERFLQHKNEYHAAEWVKIYKPLEIEQTKDLGWVSFQKAEIYENKVTRAYIKKYGLDNVRGGNLTYRGKMVSRFGYFYRSEEWKDVILFGFTAIYIFATVIYFLYAYYIK